MMDAILLARMRSRGVEDGMIRFLHDRIAYGTRREADQARHMASTLVAGPVRYYGHEEGLTAELELDHGIHWTGRGVRIASKTLPETIITSISGMPMSEVVDFEGADGLTIQSAGTMQSGGCWLSAVRQAVEPPPKAPLSARMRYTKALAIDAAKRAHVAIDDLGGGAVLRGRMLAAIAAMTVLLVATAALLTATGSTHKLQILVPLAAIEGVLVILFPTPDGGEASEREHNREMKALQEAQGWYDTVDASDS